VEADHHTNGRDRRIPRESTLAPGSEAPRVVPLGLTSGEEGRLAVPAASQEPGARDQRASRNAPALVNWQSALYVFVLGLICLVLAPLTSLWWIVPALGVFGPVALAALDLERSSVRRTGDLEPPSVLAEPESEGAPPRPGEPRRLDEPLSERELEVLGLIASGRTNSEVARDLFISVGTVKSHTGNIFRKLGANNRAEAVSRAGDLNLLP
jgi:DNA-binding CsgD family transcriptional regulator